MLISPQMDRKVYKLAVATLAVTFIAAIATWLLVPEFRRFIGWEKPDHQAATSSISGIVVDADTNQGIGQASITLVGRTEQYVTENSGNFGIELPSDIPKRIRLHVSKAGFQPLDMSVEPPKDNLVLPLRKQ